MIIESTNPLPVIHFDISQSDMTFRYYCPSAQCGVGWGVITRRWNYPKPLEGTPSPSPPNHLGGEGGGVDWCLTLVPASSNTPSNGCKCTVPRDIPFDAEGNVVGYYVKSTLPSSYLGPLPSYKV